VRRVRGPVQARVAGVGLRPSGLAGAQPSLAWGSCRGQPGPALGGSLSDEGNGLQEAKLSLEMLVVPK
jgi:hypothetical protein